jgi:hypothetical protein
MKYTNGTLVKIHSTGSPILDGLVAKVKGVSYIGPVNIYILEPTIKVDLDGYDCFTMTESCFTDISTTKLDITPTNNQPTAYILNWMGYHTNGNTYCDGTSIHRDLIELHKFLHICYGGIEPRLGDSRPTEGPKLIPITDKILRDLDERPSFWITYTSWWKGIDS